MLRCSSRLIVGKVCDIDLGKGVEGSDDVRYTGDAQNACKAGAAGVPSTVDRRFKDGMPREEEACGRDRELPGNRPSVIS